jgi:phage terminase Nu1 subunit (DNA packaging protein)
MNTTNRGPGRPAMPERIRLLDAQAEKVERENLVAAGQLLPTDRVKADWLDIVYTIRTRLLAVPARVAARHPGHPAIIKTVDDELRSALASIADDEL